MTLLTPDNYLKGFLVDEELMAGVAQDPENASSFIAFVLQHTTGQYLGYQPFSDLTPALQAINQIPRKWSYERMGGCGGGNCKGGNCGKAGGGCAGGGCSTGSCKI